MRLFDDVLTPAQYDSSDLVNYPHGRVKDDTSSGAKDGTPLMEKTWGDIYNGIVELLRVAGITSSGNPEKKEASDIADAVGFLKPVAVIRAGYSVDDSAVAIHGGKYFPGYTATISETSTSGDTVISYKLNILKDGVACGSDELILAASTAIEGGTVAAKHANDETGVSDGFCFLNNTDDNITYTWLASPGIALTRVAAQFTIIVYKI